MFAPALCRTGRQVSHCSHMIKYVTMLLLYARMSHALVVPRKNTLKYIQSYRKRSKIQYEVRHVFE